MELRNHRIVYFQIYCKDCYKKQLSIWRVEYYDSLFEKYKLIRPSNNKRFFKQQLNIINKR
jgi:hypothetical protein